MTMTGRVWRFGDHVDTDVIIPARYLVTADPLQLAPHCMEDLDPTFASRVRPGDILVAGENFGCGSSREHAPLAIRGAGIQCIVAASFARIFYRNAINIGLPIVICPEAAEAAESGQTMAVDLESGLVLNETCGASYRSEAYPAFLLNIIRAGGLVPYTRHCLRERRARESTAPERLGEDPG